MNVTFLSGQAVYIGTWNRQASLFLLLSICYHYNHYNNNAILLPVEEAHYQARKLPSFFPPTHTVLVIDFYSQQFAAIRWTQPFFTALNLRERNHTAAAIYLNHDTDLNTEVMSYCKCFCGSLFCCACGYTFVIKIKQSFRGYSNEFIWLRLITLQCGKTKRGCGRQWRCWSFKNSSVRRVESSHSCFTVSWVYKRMCYIMCIRVCSKDNGRK